jgi:hypothetical protein
VRLVIEARLADGQRDTVNEGDEVLAGVERRDCSLAQLAWPRGGAVADGQDAGRAGVETGGVVAFGPDLMSALRRGLAPQGQSLDGPAHRVWKSDGAESAAVVVSLLSDCADAAACGASLVQSPDRSRHAGA